MNNRETSFLFALAKAENGNRIGWDESKGLWFPHESLEGGTDTIAYGHKLTTDEQAFSYFKNGITELRAIDLFLQDYCKAYDRAMNQWKFRYRHLPPEKYKFILVDIVFNVGTLLNRHGAWGWPKLAKAIQEGNDQGVYEESIRTYTNPSGVRKPLTQRSISIARSQGLDFQA